MDIPAAIGPDKASGHYNRMSPKAVKGVASRLSNFYESLRTSPETEHHVKNASGWYPAANALAQKISPGNTPAGAGIIAALSPGTEWNKNQRMAEQMQGYHPEIFTRGEDAGTEAARASMLSGSLDTSIDAARRVAKGEVFERYGVRDLASQSEDNLTKAYDIQQGGNPMTGPAVGPKKEMGGVLGGNKVRSFHQNILDPSNPDPVAIDTHAHDAAVGMKLPYKRERGLTASGRYDSFAQGYRGAAAQHGLVPNEMQAATWAGWKDLKGDWSDEERLDRMGV